MKIPTPMDLIDTVEPDDALLDGYISWAASVISASRGNATLQRFKAPRFRRHIDIAVLDATWRALAHHIDASGWVVAWETGYIRISWPAHMPEEHGDE